MQLCTSAGVLAHVVGQRHQRRRAPYTARADRGSANNLAITPLSA